MRRRPAVLLLFLLAGGCSRPDSGVTEAEAMAGAVRTWEATKPWEEEFLQGFGPSGYYVAHYRIAALTRQSNATPERRAACARNGLRELRAAGLTWPEINAGFEAIRVGRQLNDILCPFGSAKVQRMKPAAEAHFLREGLYLRWDDRPPAPEADPEVHQRYKVWFRIYSRRCDEDGVAAVAALRPASPPWQDPSHEPEPAK